MQNRIIFLESVSTEERKIVRNFVKIWKNDSKIISIYTSGSTGPPKEIKISKATMKASALATGKYFGFKKGQKNILALSANYIAGMMQIVRSIVFDLQLIVTPVNSNPLQNISDFSIDFAAFVPFQVQSILMHESSKKIYESISNIIIGGAPISLNLFEEISDLKNQSFATFGMTETVSHIALKEIKKNNNLFVAIPNVSFDISENSCLTISAPHLISNSIQTKDIVRLENEFSFEWIGRADFVINSAGVKIHPEKVEKMIENVIDRTFYISKLKDNKLGYKTVLFIEGEPFDSEQIKKLCKEMKEVLIKYEVPKTILFKPVFKRTSTGKIIRE